MPTTLRQLEEELRKQAMAMVPPEYADRDLHYKYFRLDNEAAGLIAAADDIAAFRKEASLGASEHPRLDGEAREFMRELLGEDDDAAD